MINEKDLVISVPASTANLGPGFDSIGLALMKHLTLRVTSHDTWEITSQQEELKEFPNGKDHLIFTIAEKVASEYGVSIPQCFIEMESNIPLARGLGSSAAAIVAGIELADQLLSLNMTAHEKLRFASMIEGHPDNVGAAIYGGLIVGSHRDDQTNVVHLQDPQVETVVIIPSYQLLTKDARNVLPSQFPFPTAVEASSISNILVAALFTNDWNLAGKMMELDLFHQPYRSKYIPDIEAIRPVANENGSFGIALSGAGPTLICFTSLGNGERLANKLKLTFPNFKIESLNVDTKGIQTKWLVKSAK